MSIIFVAGIYGVGKSTICKKFKEINSIDYYNCSDLISKINHETYGSNKFVSDSKRNQDILVEQIKSLKEPFILTGHFCILDKNMNIETLPDTVFTNIKISKIIMLTREPYLIQNFLEKRDDKLYDIKLLEDLQNRELSLAKEMSCRLKIDLSEIDIKFDDSDYEKFSKEVGALFE